MKERERGKGAERAVVLGGGGVTGLAWETGILTGLLDCGVDLKNADTVIGTSAGSFVGAALAGGYDLTRLFEIQSDAHKWETSVSLSEPIYASWVHAFKKGGSDPVQVGALFGETAKLYPALVSDDVRRKAIEGRLVVSEWPDPLRVTAIEVETGRLHVFDKASGVPLIDAVSASGAVPGVWPVVKINGRAWTDGGMVSPANVHLAEGHKRIVILAPMPKGFGAIPGAEEDAAELNRSASVVFIKPDDDSIQAIGPNPYDSSRCGVAAAAGREQGKRTAKAVQAIW